MKKCGFIKVPKTFLREEGLSLTAKILYCTLDSRAGYAKRIGQVDEGGAYVDDATDDLAEMLGVSTRTVMRALKELEKAGLIEVTRERMQRNRVYVTPIEGTAYITIASDMLACEAMTLTDKVVYGMLDDLTRMSKAHGHEDARGVYVFPSQSRLAEALCMSAEGVRKAYKRLEEAGLIEVDHNAGSTVKVRLKGYRMLDVYAIKAEKKAEKKREETKKYELDPADVPFDISEIFGGAVKFSTELPF